MTTLAWFVVFYLHGPAMPPFAMDSPKQVQSEIVRSPNIKNN